MKKVTYSKSALKVLRRIQENEARRITGKIDQYAGNPGALKTNVKQLAGSPYLRLRVGDWRVIMDDENLVLAVLKIGPRGSVYE